MSGEGAIRTFGSRPRKRVNPDMNVTPLVDVVLVLLIIFMVLAPVMSAHYEGRLPPRDDTDRELAEQNDPLEPLVLRVGQDGGLNVGDIELEDDRLVAQQRIERMLNARPNTLLYLDASDTARYSSVLQGMQTARLAGANPVVFVTKEIPAGS